MDIKGVTEKKVDQLVAAANKVAEFTFIVRRTRRDSSSAESSADRRSSRNSSNAEATIEVRLRRIKKARLLC